MLSPYINYFENIKERPFRSQTRFFVGRKRLLEGQLDRLLENVTKRLFLLIFVLKGFDVTPLDQVIGQEDERNLFLQRGFEQVISPHKFNLSYHITVSFTKTNKMTTGINDRLLSSVKLNQTALTVF